MPCEYTPEEREAAFWARVDKSAGPDECWPWRGTRHSARYGHLRQGGRLLRAHRVAWEMSHGPIPKGDGYHGTCVCHTCDNRPCCNPSHLFLGTQADNMADCVAKGRANKPAGDDNWTRNNPQALARGDRNGARLHPQLLARGASNGRAVLDDERVCDIRAASSAGESGRSIARRFGVHEASIRRILNRTNWAHVEAAEAARGKA